MGDGRRWKDVPWRGLPRAAERPSSMNVNILSSLWHTCEDCGDHRLIRFGPIKDCVMALGRRQKEAGRKDGRKARAGNRVEQAEGRNLLRQ